MRIELKWYDLWVGIFIDTNQKKVYLCPLPCLVISWTYASH